MSVDLVAKWLKPFGVDDFEGRCELSYQDHIDVTVETTAEGDTLFLSAVLGELPENPDPKVLRHLLQLGNKGAGTGGASLALDETGQNVILWHAWPVSALGPEEFEETFGAFLDSATALREKLALESSEVPEDHKGAPGQFSIQV